METKDLRDYASLSTPQLNPLKVHGLERASKILYMIEEGHWYCGSCNIFGHAHNSCQKNQKPVEMSLNEGGRDQWAVVDKEEKKK